MKIINRGKAKYRIGTIALQNTNVDNLVVLNKCVNFAETSLRPESAKRYTEQNQFDMFTDVLGDTNSFKLFGEVWRLPPPNGQIEVFIDFINHAIEFVGVNGVDKSATMTFDCVLLDMNDYDHAFGQMIQYMLPTYDISTVTKTGGVYDSKLPVTGDLRSIVTTATCTAKKTRTNIRSIIYEQSFDQNGIVSRRIRLIKDGIHEGNEIIDLDDARLNDTVYAMHSDRLVRTENYSMVEADLRAELSYRAGLL